jgi:hypothetical protein
MHLTKGIRDRLLERLEEATLPFRMAQRAGPGLTGSGQGWVVQSRVSRGGVHGG